MKNWTQVHTPHPLDPIPSKDVEVQKKQADALLEEHAKGVAERVKALADTPPLPKWP